MTATHTRVRVRSVEHLEQLCDGKQLDFCVALNGGVVSRKNISWDDGEFCVFNGINGTFDLLTREQLHRGFLGEAIEKGALYTDL